MPVMIQHKRNGEPLPYRWGGWHLRIFFEAADNEGVKLASTGSFTATREQTFVDPADGEVVTILPGDTVEAWRG